MMDGPLGQTFKLSQLQKRDDLFIVKVQLSEPWMIALEQEALERCLRSVRAAESIVLGEDDREPERVCPSYLPWGSPVPWDSSAGSRTKHWPFW
jgi:hypothetical protein